MQKKGSWGQAKREAATSLFNNTKCPQVRALIMIILNSKNFKSKQEQIKILELYKTTDDFYNLECPYCQSDEFIKWSSYSRIIYYLDENNKLKVEILEIKRVRCQRCQKTHALLPECIVPYKQPTLDIILKSINEDPETYEYPFSYDTIQSWKKIYRKYLPYLKTMFNNIKEIIPQILNKIVDTYEEFYKINKLIIMLSHKGIYNMACF